MIFLKTVWIQRRVQEKKINIKFVHLHTINDTSTYNISKGINIKKTTLQL